MEKRASAFGQYNEAAVLQMLIEVLPQIAKEVAAALASIDKLTVVSTDGAGALPRQVTNNVVQTLELLKNTTSVALRALIQRYTGDDEEPTTRSTTVVAAHSVPTRVVGGNGLEPPPSVR